jgi:hypothetical protein
MVDDLAEMLHAGLPRHRHGVLLDQGIELGIHVAAVVLALEPVVRCNAGIPPVVRV